MRGFLIFLTPMLLFSQSNEEIYGIFTLIPPVVAILLAFITKDVIVSLFFGVLSGTFMLSITTHSFFSSIVLSFNGLITRIINSLANSWNAGVVLQVLCIGGLVALITKMGGTKAVALWLAKRSKSRISAQITTWLMGLCIFFDDYANALIVGPIMRPISDKFKVSRAKLAFIIDATAAPVAGIALISTWIGLEISLIKDSYALIGIKNVNAFSVFIDTIPYRFYNIFMLFFVAISALSSREFGPMYKSEQDAKKGTEIKVDKGNIDLDYKEFSKENGYNIEEDYENLISKDGISYKKINLLLPVGLLIIGAFIGFYFNGLSNLSGEVLKNVKLNPVSLFAFKETFGAANASIVLFESALFATIVAVIMGIYQKIYKLGEAIEIWIDGWKGMVITIAILLLAWSLSSVIKDLETSKYLVKLLSDKTPYFILPALIFSLASVISFATGTSYGTMGILMPLAIPFASVIASKNGYSGAEFSEYLFICISGVLTGAIFGDHCSPISDTTILSSMGAGCNHIEHVSTQFVYAIIVCLISVISYFLVSFGLNVWICIILGFISIYLIIRFFGKKV